MRIDFKDKGYVSLDEKDNKVIISIGASNQNDILSTIINSAELTKEEFKLLISAIKISSI